MIDRKEKSDEKKINSNRINDVDIRFMRNIRRCLYDEGYRYVDYVK